MESILIILVLISFSLLAYLNYSCVSSQERFNQQLLQKQKVIQKMQETLNQLTADRNQIDLKFHDKLGANLSALNLHISVIKKHIPEQKFLTIHRLLNDSIQETRKISVKMDTPELLTQENYSKIHSIV